MVRLGLVYLDLVIPIPLHHEEARDTRTTLIYSFITLTFKSARAIDLRPHGSATKTPCTENTRPKTEHAFQGTQQFRCKIEMPVD